MMLLWFVAIPIGVALYFVGCWHERRGWRRTMTAAKEHYREELADLVEQNRQLKTERAERGLPAYMRRSSS